jgi:hypothetical protein
MELSLCIVRVTHLIHHIKRFQCPSWGPAPNSLFTSLWPVRRREGWGITLKGQYHRILFFRFYPPHKNPTLGVSISLTKNCFVKSKAIEGSSLVTCFNNICNMIMFRFFIDKTFINDIYTFLLFLIRFNIDLKRNMWSHIFYDCHFKVMLTVDSIKK